MRIGMIAMMIATVGVNFGMGGCVQDATEKSMNLSPMAERLKVESLTGRVESVTGTMNDRYILIKVGPQDTRIVHIDGHTRMDKVAIGDRVIAFVVDDGYAAIVQHKGAMPPSGGYSLMGSGAP